MVNKVVLLMPTLMADSRRAMYNKALDYALKYYPVDGICINAQEFKPEDFREGIHYIVNEVRQGFADSRNQLLEWFYNSDYEWAVWMDANATVSKPSLSDFYTLIRAVQRDEVPVDVIYSTLGIRLQQERIDVKLDSRYKDSVLLLENFNGAEWFHGLFMRNFKRKYGEEPLIDARCDPMKGVPEDAYFALLLRRLYDSRLAPAIVVNKPPNKFSTWVADKGGYDYPKVNREILFRWIEQNVLAYNYPSKEKTLATLILPREEAYREWLQPYKPRKKIKKILTD